MARGLSGLLTDPDLVWKIRRLFARPATALSLSRAPYRSGGIQESSRRRDSGRARKLLHRSHRSTLASPKAEDTSKRPPNRPLELKPHRTRGRPPRKAGPNHKHNPKSQVGGVTLMLTAAFLRFKLGTPRQRQKRNSRLASSASWDERVRTPLIYFPLKLRLWRGGHIEGGDPMGWNQVWWWLEWISTVGQGERGGCHGGGGERDAGWVSSKNAECPQTTQPPRQRQLADRRLSNSHEAPSAPRVSLAPL